MSTLKNTELKQLDDSIESAKGLSIDKEDVLTILVNKIKERDVVNSFIVDRIDVVALKEIYNDIIKL